VTLVLVLLAIDLGTKYWARSAQLTVYGPTEILHFLWLVLAFNPGLTFGGALGIAGHPVATTLLTSAISAALAVWMWRERRTSAKFLIAFALAGALGNTIDRILNSMVTDFLQLRLGGSFQVVINLADVWILIAVVGLTLMGRRARRI
jgi:signal peptidase II